MIQGIDCSNYYDHVTQDWANAVVAAGIQRVTLRLSLERQAFINIARHQHACFTQAGAVVDGYVWCYQNAERAEDLCGRVLDAYGDLGIPIVWLDLEDEDGYSYNDPAQNIDWLHRALAGFDAVGQPVGCYTGRWYWVKPNRYANTTEFADRLLWTSDFDRNPDLSSTWRYGGWGPEKTAGKQWCGESSGPEAYIAGVAVDRSVWDTDKLPGNGEDAELSQAEKDELAFLRSWYGLTRGDYADDLQQQHDALASLPRMPKAAKEPIAELANLANTLRQGGD